MEDIKLFRGKDGAYHYFYRITNTINGKVYFGIHSTNNLDDGYLGSGTYLAQAKRKYGEENFRKDILRCFETREELGQYEKAYVTVEFLEGMTGKCYNLKEGGDEATPGVRMFRGTEELFVPKRYVQEKLQEGYTTGVWISSGSCNQIYNPNMPVPVGWQKGRSEDIRQTLGHNKGYRYITSGSVQKMVPESEGLPEGWRYGISEETRKRRRGKPSFNKGMVRITDGTCEHFIVEGKEVPKGWVRGVSDRSKERKSKAHLGRIVITDGTRTKRIYPENGIPEGWKRGLPEKQKEQRLIIREEKKRLGNFRTKGKRRITDGIRVRYISPEEQIPEGWFVGYTEEQRQVLRNRPKTKGTTGMVHITNGDQNKVVLPEKVQGYLDLGWRLGSIKRKPATNRGRVWMCNKAAGKNVRVIPEQVNSLLQQGYSLGQLKSHGN